MTVRCTFHEKPPADPKPGDMWFLWDRSVKADRSKSGYSWLSESYWREHADRRPALVIVCPGGGHWIPDQKSANGDGWTVTGEPPRITARPSILVQPSPVHAGYHGRLTDGVFSDDIDGRRPAAEG